MGRMLSILLAFTGLVTVLEAAQPPAECPEDWKVFNTRCWFDSYNYKEQHVSTTWNDAQKFCLSVGANLASIYNSAENAYALSEFCSKNPGKPRGNYVPGVCWIGLYQVQGQGSTYQWIDGTALPYTNWASGEPNNVGNNGEDCGQMWNRKGIEGQWNDEPCSNTYSYLCTKPALCSAGWYQSVAFDGPKNILASCEQCPGGTFRSSVGGIGVESCTVCPAGWMSGKGSTSCSTVCPKGYFCPEGTNKDDLPGEGRGMQPCLPGTYGDVTGLKSASQCGACDPGYYCSGNGETTPTPSGQICDAGRCGFAKQSSPSCNQACPAGYYCTGGSACPGAEFPSGNAASNTASECGGTGFYCPSGSIDRRKVSDGYYSVGGTETTRSGQSVCEPGYFCSGGVRSICPGGHYTDKPGAESGAACLPCFKGYICPENEVNTGPRSINCYERSFIETLGSPYTDHIDYPEMFYCPEQSSLPKIVEDGKYSVPVVELLKNNRESQVVCDKSEVCVNGLASPILSWSTGSVCDDGVDSFTVLEMTSAGKVRNIPASLHPSVSPSSYQVSYALESQNFIDADKLDCAMDSLAKNKDIFTFSAGSLSLSRSDLDYEVCLPELDIAYLVVVKAEARLVDTNEFISSITCKVTVNVDDANDKPEFYDYNDGDGVTEKIFHRQIPEKVDRNVPVAICDTTGELFGCPPGLNKGSEINLPTRDQDDGSVLRYSFLSGDGGATGNPFKIDPCTGQVSAVYSKNISYSAQKTYTYSVKIEDDGNGGRYTPKSDTATLIIHVIDENDAPVFDPNQPKLTIKENQPAGTATNAMVSASDEDGDSLVFQVATNDADAFRITNNTLVTTQEGAEAINYESAKKFYSIEIEVQDNRGGFDSKVFIIEVVNQNDPPTFKGSTVFYVKENLADTPVCTDTDGECRTGPGAVETTDEDRLATDKTTYSLSHPLFSIDPNTGVIKTKSALDFEADIDLPSGTGRGYLLEITAKSSGIPGDNTEKSSVATVTVYVVDVNEAPAFTSTGPFQVLESWPIGYIIPGLIKAQDPDNADDLLLGKAAPKQTLSYSLGTSNEYFQIQTNSDGDGEIKLIKALDFESSSGTISLDVVVEDNGGPVRQRSTASVSVTIVDSNDPPKFAEAKVSVTAPENTPFQSISLQAVDEDSGTKLTYSIVGGNGAQLFELVPSGNAFSVKQRSVFQGTSIPFVLNYELSSKEWNLNIQVEDEGPSSRIATACNPSVSNSCGGGAICDNGRCHEKCYDTSTTAAKDIPFDEFNRCDYKGATPIEKINGVDTPFYTEKAEMTFIVVVTDLNDPPKMKDCPLALTVSSNQASQSQNITKAGYLDSLTSDEDSLNTISDYVYPYTFSLPPSKPTWLSLNTAKNYLQYTPTSDVIAEGEEYPVVLTVTDSQGASSTCNMVIDVILQNTIPRIENVRTIAVAENTINIGSGEIVLLEKIVVYDDNDDNEKFTFSTSLNPYFDLDPATGKITVGTTVVSYESLYPTHEYTMIVQVQDKYGASDVAEVSIPITDVNEAPVFKVIPAVQIQENNAVNAEILGPLLNVFVSDPDIYATDSSWKTLTFAISSCASAYCPFSINPATGALRATDSLNFEGSQNQWFVTVSATDGGGLSSSGQVEVTLTDVNEPPKFNSSNVEVSIFEGDLDSNARLFYMLDVVQDEDAQDTPATLEYSITSGNNDNLFTIEDGYLKRQGAFVVDYESVQKFVLEVQAKDSANNIATATVTIRVKNVNDVEITSVSATSKLSCSGGSEVVISGRNFGLKDSSKWSATTVVIKYQNPITGVEYTCGSVRQVTNGDNTQLACKTAAAIGNSFKWRVTISVTGYDIQGDSSAYFTSGGVSYVAPAITSITGVENLPTKGGSTFTLKGTCLGTIADFPSDFGGYGVSNYLSYCTKDGICKKAGCAFTPSNDLSCTSAPGVGSEFRWTVWVLGTPSVTFQKGGYAAPSIISVTFSTFKTSGVFPVDTPFVIKGENFGDIDSIPEQAYASYQLERNPLITRNYAFAGCVVTTAFEEVTCTGIAPGIGRKMQIYVIFGGQSNVVPPSSTLVQYEAPKILSSSGEGLVGASTAGGQRIIVKGTGFGPICGKVTSNANGEVESVVCDIVYTTYTRGSRRVTDNSLIVYTAKCAVTAQDTQMDCVTAPGTGSDHAWTFDIAGYSVGGVSSSYQPPTVGGYDGVGSKLALTSGNQQVVVKGSNFGPLNGAPVIAYYGPEEDDDEFKATKCRVVLENEQIECFTVEGAGDELKWKVVVDGQESRAEVTDYGPPQISTFVGRSGAVISSLDNSGEETVEITGLNFGPPNRLEYLEFVSYGPASNPRAYLPKCVVDSHSQITCSTVAGIGTNLKWLMQVKGQESQLSGSGTSYIPPTLDSMSKSNGITDGDYRIRLTGKGFAICDSNAVVTVMFGSQEVPIAGFYDSAVGTVPVDISKDCPLSKSSTKAVEFSVPPMTGEYSQDLFVRIKSSLFSEVYKTNSFNFKYDPPQLDSVYAEPTGDDVGDGRCTGQYRVTLRGKNFCKSDACCQAVLNGRTDNYILEEHSHRTIIMCTSSIGVVYVKCGDRSSNIKELDSANPFIFQTTTSQGTPLKDLRYPTKATGSDEIYIWGVYFGSSNPIVTIGGTQVTVSAHAEIACDDASIPAHTFGDIITLNTKCWKTTVIVPSGQGHSNEIIVKAASSDQTSLANNDFEFLNYRKPVIASVTGSFPAPTTGGTEVVFTGSDFGLSGEVRALEYSVSGLSLPTWAHVGMVNCSSYSHEKLTCTIPPGEGKDLSFFLVVGNQDTTAQLGAFKFSYVAPTVSNIEYNGGGRTVGGDLVVVSGSSFGRPFRVDCESALAVDCTPIRPQVTIGALLCEFVSNTQSSIKCRIPEGEGKGLPMTVNVRNQVAQSGILFNFLPPEINYFSPANANTNGLDENGDRDVMIISGDNFGIDKLSVSFSLDGLEFVVAQRDLENDVNDFLFRTNHTEMYFLVPEFRGKDIQIKVEVAGQSVIASQKFSYRPPSVADIITEDADGNEQDWEGGSTEEITDTFFSESRRLLQSVSDAKQFQIGGASPCEINMLNRGFSWRTVVNDIYEANSFVRTTLVYSGELCSASSILFAVTVEGELRDIRDEDLRSPRDCTTTYEQVTSSVKVTPQNTDGAKFLSVSPTCCDQTWEINVERDITQCIAQSACSSVASFKSFVQTGTNYGIYYFTERKNLFFSKPVSLLENVRNAEVFELPRTPSSVLIDQKALQSPQGPTSGCFLWEPYRDFLRRRREAFANTGSAIDIYRKCLKKAMMTLQGENFSTNMFNASRQIRVFFYSDSSNKTVEFEAATVSSKGDHPEPCSEDDGCVHDHTKIKFQIPPGYGRNLKMRIAVGNQVADAVNSTSGLPIFFHYNAPQVDFASPGSLFNGDGFQNADGDESVQFMGEDFGGVLSPASILMSGRVCSNATWRSGDEDEEGKPFLSCEAERDVTGSKSLFVCVAGQVAFTPAVKSDSQILSEADRIRDTDSARVDSLYRDTASIINSRCKSTYDVFGNSVGRMGGIGELCVPCPDGSICNEPDSPFSPPKSQEGFFRLDVPVFNEDGTVTDRAQRRCMQERWDKDLINSYPGLVFSETCSDYVSCEPAEACTSGNDCATEYQYAYSQCQAKRNGDSAYNNSCSVTFNPFTGAYEGVQTDCNPNPNVACSPDKPEQCSTCNVHYEDGVAFGQCECTMPKQCSLCSLYTHFRLYNRCKECPNNPGLIIAMFIVTILLAIGGGWYLNKKRINLALFSVALDYLQVLAVFSSVNIVWPESLLALFNLLSFFNFNIDIAGPECLIPTLEYETKWYLMETMPLAVAGLLIFIHLAYSAFKFARAGRQAKFTSHISRLISVFLIIMYVLYLNVTRKSLDVFNCNPLPSQDDGYLYTSFTSLSCDGGSLCKCGEGIQSRLVPLAAVFLVIYGVGFPLAVFMAIRKYRTLIREDQYLRASGIGDSRVTNPRAYDVRKRFSALYMHFKPERTYWILTILARKFGVAAAALMFRSNTTFQLSVILLVLFVSFCLHLQYRPYLSTGERSFVLKDLDEKAERGLDIPEFKSYLDMQKHVQECVKKSKEAERKDRAKFGGKDMWKDEDKLTKHAKKTDIRRRAQELFFDYNTVEAVLLASAIFICLGGVMFSSGRFVNREDIAAQRDFIAYLVIICVVLTFIYMILVILVEIFPTLSVTGCTKFISNFQRRKPENHEVVDLDSDLQFDTNPLFENNGMPKKSKRDGRLEAELERNQEELDRVAQQNEELRKELANQKKKDQQSDFTVFGVPNPFLKGRKKTEFKPAEMRSEKKDMDQLFREESEQADDDR